MLAGLPVLYYLLRVTPPNPNRVPFPPLRLILDLQPRDETAARTPWWLLLLRLAIAAAIILAMAGPVLNPLPTGAGGKAPLLVVIDDGWAAAPSWDTRQAAASERIEAAGRNGELVAVAAVSDAGREIVLSDATHAVERLRAIKPLPYVPDHLALLIPIRSWSTPRRRRRLSGLPTGLLAVARASLRRSLRGLALASHW